MIKTTRQRKPRIPVAAYIGYLFQSFLKRPFGYIVASLYVVYLAVIFLIVPKALNFEPLMIWNLGGFNMPIFNLFFIAGASASIAVAVFRTSRDDGTDLLLSAKPMTKGITVAVKTFVFLAIMLIMCLMSVIIVSLIEPVFGQYDMINNVTGIEHNKYVGLILSIFVGNLVNMLFFGSIAVFIAMVGGQVITIIGNIGVVILLCVMNMIYPQAIKSSTEILFDKYNSEIYSYSCNTLHQFNHPEEGDNIPLNFTTIGCFAPDGVEQYHFDTYEYWTKACNESGRLKANYADFGKQLSSLFNGFGQDELRLQEASKLTIGLNNNYVYDVNKESHVADNIEDKNYPILLFDCWSDQGTMIAQTRIVGADMNINADNWYARSSIFNYDFNAVSVLSDGFRSTYLSQDTRNRYENNVSHRINELHFTDPQDEITAKAAFDRGAEMYSQDPSHNPRDLANFAIKEKFPGYDDLSPSKKYDLVSKIQMCWIIYAMEQQIASITKTITDVSFPFNSAIICEWFTHLSPTYIEGEWNRVSQIFANRILDEGIVVEGWNPTPLVDHWTTARLHSVPLNYVETYSNMYTYRVSNFYNTTQIIIIWSVISGILFAGAIVVYKKTDFK